MLGKTPNARAKFLAFLKRYDHDLRGLARHGNHLHLFGYAFNYTRHGANLMYRGQELGRVRWHNGSIDFEPPLPNGHTPALTNEVFRTWVARAEHLHTTGI
jgi:hypothetical protein